MLFHLSIVYAKNQSVILVNIDQHPMKLVYQSWIRPDLNEEGEWQSYDGTKNCIEHDATDVIIIETSDEQMPINFFQRYPDIERIEITQKHLKSIDASDFLNANSLLRLNVSHNDIQHIAAYAFDAAPKLTEIDLSFNLVYDLNENIFTSYLIKYLYLHNNQLTEVNPLWFENLLYLRVLTLNNNRIQTIDWQLFNVMPNINVLHLHSNEIVDVMQNDQQTPRSLQAFSFHDNPVAVASHQWIWLDAVLVDVRNTGVQICHIAQRQHTLIAANNEIREINLNNLSEPHQNSLVTLHLANNQLKSIENVTYFQRLQYLNLSYNLLTHIEPQVFAALNDLQLLDLNHNKLKRFDVENNRLQNLGTLDVSFNELLTLDLGGIMSQLENLKFDGNKIKATHTLRQIVNHEIKCLDETTECHGDLTHRHTKQMYEKPIKHTQISDEIRDFIYEQFHIMEKNILVLIDARFMDIDKRVRRLEQEMIVVTSKIPDNHWD